MSLIVPALLQTPDYARAVIGAVRPDLPRAEIDRRVELRVRRQGLLDQERPPAMRVLLDDTVLARPVGGPAVMAAQRLLAETPTGPAVTIRVLEVAAGAHAGMDGPFTIFGFAAPAERDVVALDSAADALYLESPEDLRRYRRVFELLLPAPLPRRRPRCSVPELELQVELPAPHPAEEGVPLHGGELQHRAPAPLLGSRSAIRSPTNATSTHPLVVLRLLLRHSTRACSSTCRPAPHPPRPSRPVVGREC